MDTLFRALVAREDGTGGCSCAVETRSLFELPAGNLLVQVHYSSLNYKDALSASGNRGVTKKYPHTPGVDAAGRVVDSTVPDFAPGHEVLVCGFDLGMNTAGGFGQYIRVPKDWALPLPSGLTLRRSMEIGTAGFTAGQCVDTLLRRGLKSDHGPILVTGATGGVGSIATMLLAELGFTVVALTGKNGAISFLQQIGAAEVLERDSFARGGNRMLLRERWAGVVDTVGGEILAAAIKSTKYGGCVTCCGNAASAALPLNVYPFILRGVGLQGIDSAACSLNRRLEIWQAFASAWKLAQLADLCSTISLEQLPEVIPLMLSGKTQGRYLVDLQGANR